MSRFRIHDDEPLLRPLMRGNNREEAAVTTARPCETYVKSDQGLKADDRMPIEPEDEGERNILLEARQWTKAAWTAGCYFGRDRRIAGWAD